MAVVCGVHFFLQALCALPSPCHPGQGCLHGPPLTLRRGVGSPAPFLSPAVLRRSPLSGAALPPPAVIPSPAQSPLPLAFACSLLPSAPRCFFHDA